MIIYVVKGRTGEYSDHRTWSIVAYRSEHLAKVHVTEATKKAKEIELSSTSRWDIPRGTNEWDKNMDMDYTGTSYYIEPVELKEQL